VIAPRTKIDVLPSPGVSDDGWRMAFLVDELADQRETIVTLSERDLNAYTQPSPA